VGFLSPGTAVLIGVLILVYGLLIGGTWVTRHDGKLFDTISAVAMLVIAAVVACHLVIVGARQAEAFQKARDRLNCVAVQLDAVRVQAPMPECSVKWDGG
jgi:hypothetical protein